MTFSTGVSDAWNERLDKSGCIEAQEKEEGTLKNNHVKGDRD